jgi:hypothetical protein
VGAVEEDEAAARLLLAICLQTVGAGDALKLWLVAGLLPLPTPPKAPNLPSNSSVKGSGSNSDPH